MATYKQIQEYVKMTYGVPIDTCHIAHMKQLLGLPVVDAHNRKSPDSRVKECPEKIKPLIEEAFKHFNMHP